MTTLLRFPATTAKTVAGFTALTSATVPAGSYLLTGVLEVDADVPSAAWFQCSLSTGPQVAAGIAGTSPASITYAQLRVPVQLELTLAAPTKVTLTCARNSGVGGTVWMKSDLRLLRYATATTLPS